MIIDPEGNSVGIDPFQVPRPSFGVRAVWGLSLVALIVGVAAAAAFALWVALILIPLGIVASGIAGIIYRLRLARLRKAMAVASRG